MGFESVRTDEFEGRQRCIFPLYALVSIRTKSTRLVPRHDSVDARFADVLLAGAFASASVKRKVEAHGAFIVRIFFLFAEVVYGSPCWKHNIYSDRL